MNFKISIILIGIAMTAYAVLYFCLYPTKELESELPIKLEQPEFFLEDKPTKELVKEACEYYGIKHSDIVVAQSILETGHYKSQNCTKHHNLFGLYNSKKKEFFKFNHWTESVKAYRDMIQYRYTEGDYYQWLEKIGYAEDPLYVQKLVNIKKRYSL
jgi:flagellum-specific peptidoglycan hydrolase FlgJ